MDNRKTLNLTKFLQKKETWKNFLISIKNFLSSILLFAKKAREAEAAQEIKDNLDLEEKLLKMENRRLKQILQAPHYFQD